MRFSRHPGYRTLNRFADGELPPEKHRRVSTHLAQCGRCRQEVAFIRRAGDLARSLPTPPAPEELLEKVLSRREDGDRVLLPLESPGSSAPTPWKVAPAAAAVLVLFTIGLFASTGLLEADRGGLDIEPDRPRAAETLTLRYEDDGTFTGDEYLKLRARYRTASGNHWEQIAGILTRVDDEVFQAELPLPDSVVYAAFVVEDLHAHHVDSNNREYWEVLVHGDDRRPTLTALGEQLMDLYARNPAAAYRTARQLTELYPESPRGWSMQWAFEQDFVTADSLQEVHHRRLREFERAFSERPPRDPEELAHLAWYASQLGEWGSADYWSREAERRDADSRTFYQIRAILVRLSDQRIAAALERLESLWNAAPFPVAAISDAAITGALDANDWQAVQRWLPRYQQARDAVDGAALLERLEEAFGADRTLDWALAHLDHEILRPGSRPLFERRDQYQRSVARQRQRTLGAVAEVALEAGDRGIARGLALEALPMAWETPALESIARVLLEAGDTANAVLAFARAGADPASNPAPEAVTRAPGWADALEAARAELTRHVMTESVIRYPPEELRQETGPAVVAFQLTCADDVERLNRLPESLGNVPVTVYTLFDPGTVGAADRCAGLSIPVRLDSTGEIGNAFRVRGYPSYFITDADGRIRFEHSHLDQVPRQLQALRHASDPSMAD